MYKSVNCSLIECQDCPYYGCYGPDPESDDDIYVCMLGLEKEKKDE